MYTPVILMNQLIGLNYTIVVRVISDSYWRYVHSYDGLLWVIVDYMVIPSGKRFHNYMENHHVINGKTHDFYGHSW